MIRYTLIMVMEAQGFRERRVLLILERFQQRLHRVAVSQTPQWLDRLPAHAGPTVGQQAK